MTGRDNINTTSMGRARLNRDSHQMRWVSVGCRGLLRTCSQTPLAVGHCHCLRDFGSSLSASRAL